MEIAGEGGGLLLTPASGPGETDTDSMAEEAGNAHQDKQHTGLGKEEHFPLKDVWAVNYNG